MNKTINVNIGGLPFTVDEDAHLMLSNYLHQIENRLSPLERREIMEDVENRIADIFSQKLSIRAQVISIAMVRDAIATIGHAEDFGEPQNNGSFQNQSQEQEKQEHSASKGLGFQRSRTEKMLGGICGGLSPVLGIDVTILRLILIVLTIVSFSVVFWAYIILWIIVPREPETTNINDQKNERR